MTLAALTMSDLRLGQKVSLAFRVTSADMQAFGQISGDWNPIHTDESFALSRGFEKPVVYGGLIVAKISKLLGMDLPGRNGIWCSLRLEFKNPLYLEEEAEIIAEVRHISEAAGLVAIELTLHAAAKLLAHGRAEVLVVCD